MVWRIVSRYGMARANEAVADFSAAVEAFEASATSPPQRRLIEVEHSKLGSRLAQLGAEIARENRETARLRADYDVYLQAAHLLAVDLERTMDGKLSEESERSLQIEASLARLVGRLEEIKPEIEREASDDSDTAAWLAALMRTEQALAAKLRDAGSSVSEQMDRQDSAQHAAAFAGAVSAMSVTVDAMIERSASFQAQVGQAQVRTSTLDAGLLRLEQLVIDPRIGAAVDQVRRGRRDDGRDLTARLTALGSRERPAGLRAAE